MLVGKDGKEIVKIHNVVTSFNEEGYKKYGKEFIDSFLKFWPKNVRLTVYYEGEDFPFTEGLSWIPVEDVEFYKEFFECLNFPIFHGIVGNQYDINFDARMCRKVLIQMHSMKKYKGKVFWVDADVVTFDNVPESFLDEVLPDDCFNCYLGRDGWYYTESGFIGFNSKHELANWFYKNYINTVMSGVIFTQPGWHDCYAFDAIRTISNKPEAFNNLAKDVPHGTMHPYINTVLGRYMNHKKGTRKTGEPFREGDLVVSRDEAYWHG